MDNLDAFSYSSLEFLRELGRRLGSLSGEEREASFLFQRLSVKFNSVPFQLVLSFLFLTLGHYTLEGIKIK